MNLVFSDNFNKSYKKISDKKLRHQILNKFKKLLSNPYLGKPLKYQYKNCRSLKISKYRIIYRIGNDVLFVFCLEHRKNAYE